MEIKQLELPSTYTWREGISPEEHKIYEGRPQMSYSSYNSFLEEAYKGEFFGNKFLGLDRESTIFTEFGSAMGSFLETGNPQVYLSNYDMEVLKRENPAHEDFLYEKDVS